MRWCLILWLHQASAAVYDVHVKRVQFTTRVQVSMSAAPFDRRRVMAGVHVLYIIPTERERAAFVSEPCRQMDASLDRV